MAELLASLRAEHGWRNDPFRARWVSLNAPKGATVCAFSPRGRFLAVGHLDGDVHVWEVSSGARTLVRTLRPPPITPVLRGRGISAIAWAGSARVLLAVSCGGVLIAYDVAASLALRVLILAPVLGMACGAPRAIRAHPTIQTLAILVPTQGMPFLIYWGGGGKEISSGRNNDSGGGGGGGDDGSSVEGGGAWQISEALLPPPVSKKSRATLARRGAVARGGGASALVTDAVWAPTLSAAEAGEIFVATTRGDIVRLRVPLICGNRTVIRLAAALTASPLVVPPELRSTVTARGAGSRGALLLTTRAGLALFDAFALTPLPAERYAEPVDNTALVSARFGAGDAFVFALPHIHSGHMAGGVYAFKRGEVGHVRLKRAPAESGGIIFFDAAPHQALLVGIGARGATYILAEPVVNRWPGPMYPPGET
jgi:hypothetical protein